MARNSAELDNILEAAKASASRFGTSYIGSEHLVYAMLNSNCVAGKILTDNGVNMSEYNDYFIKAIDKSAQSVKGFTPRTRRMIESAADLAEDIYGTSAIVGTAHLLAVVLNCRDCIAMRIFIAINVNFDILQSMLEKAL